MKNKDQITMRFLAQPTDANFSGKVHGGTMMKWIDEAGYACATQWTGSYCVTAHVGDVSFTNPIKIGSLVEIVSRVVHTGNTSIHIAVRVCSRDLKNESGTEAIHCLLIFVAVDDDGNSVSVPKWQPKSKQDHELNNYAIKLLGVRRALYKDIGSIEF